MEELLARVKAIDAESAEESLAVSRKHYRYQTDRFHVTIWDPVIYAYDSLRDEFQQVRNRKRRRGNRISKRLGDPTYSEEVILYDWHEVAMANYAPLMHAVTIQVTPKIGETGGSIAKSIAAAALSEVRLRQNLKFKGEFYHMRVMRDEQELEPVYPGRRLVEESRNDRFVEFRDQAYSGNVSIRLHGFHARRIIRD